MNKIFWKIREALTSSYAIRQELKEIKRNQKTKNEELFAFQMVAPYLGEKYFPLTGYVLSPLLVQKILNEISLNKCKQILEFGSGFSSIVVCNFILKHNLDVHFTTVDNDAAYLEYVKSHISNPNDSRFKFLAAPIEEKAIFMEANQWYSIPALSSALVASIKYDLILVDGPYGKLQKNIRFGFMDTFQNNYDENTIFYIDDTNRMDEQNIVKQLKTKFNMDSWEYGNTTRLFKGNRYKV